MLVHFLGKVHKGFGVYGTPNPQELEDYEIKEIENKGVDEIWYWYHSGNYEGSGQILMRRGDLYDIHNAGHCSCYGPTDDIEFNGKPLDDLAKSLSKEYMENEARELFEMAGYKS